MDSWNIPVEFVQRDCKDWFFLMEYGQSEKQPVLFGPYPSLISAAVTFAMKAMED
jgi:hypothetical protein